MLSGVGEDDDLSAEAMEAGLSPASWGVGLQSFRSEVAFAPSKPQPALAEEAYWKTLWEASRSMSSPHVDFCTEHHAGIFVQLASS